ncbi:50S ribosomal protein L4 [Gammaproteobacteria bacterium]|jgi:large subunit ribosomal protein L4|nr:50S ribosomal protein L4 [Gammaproteobacteria bacterium]|tara:strand:- start:328 stop:951 length:624 start_codon:yes stop_codon:yes gene_type:complete
MEIQVLNQSGSQDSKMELPDSIFGQTFNEDLVHQLITTYISNSHQGTKGQKNRSAVRGGGRKPWKQKGTGRARAGTIRSPIWKGGGVTFAHTYQNVKPKKINRKMYRSAMRSIWSKLAEEEKIIAINDISIDSPPKSSQVKLLLTNLGLESVLAVLPNENETLSQASKNLNEFNVQTIGSIDPSLLFKAKKVLITSETLESLNKVLS